MVNRLLDRGYASVREILTMSFGEWPVKGLDIDPDVQHDRKIDFRLRKDTRYAGMVMLGGSTIYVNDELESYGFMKSMTYGRHTLMSVIGHEVTHVLQGLNRDYSLLYAVRDFMAFAEKTDELNYYKLTEREKEGLKSNFHASARNKIKKKLHYFRKDIEIQARLHEVMADCYQHCGRLPKNLDELWMAFSSFGVKPPADVTRRLEDIPVESSAYDFKVAEVPDFRSRKELQIALHLYSEPVQSMFWHKTLPVIYGDLITMYGDREGIRRFGFEPVGQPRREKLADSTTASKPNPAAPVAR